MNDTHDADEQAHLESAMMAAHATYDVDAGKLFLETYCHANLNIDFPLFNVILLKKC